MAWSASNAAAEGGGPTEHRGDDSCCRQRARSSKAHASRHVYSTSAAKRILRGEGALRRRGTVFPDRFHQEIITTPKQARHALAYVLNNWRKHGEDRWEFATGWNVDPYSTGAHFDGWKEREDALTLCACASRRSPQEPCRERRVERRQPGEVIDVDEMREQRAIDRYIVEDDEPDPTRDGVEVRVDLLAA